MTAFSGPRSNTGGGGGSGTVTTVSVVSANGFAGTVADPATIPAITLSTTITGILKGDGTSISAASSGTDYVTASSTNTFTNKTYDTAGAGNSFSINGVAVTANTGTGAVARATSPTFTNPSLGVASATTVNKVTLTTPATGSTLTIADGKTLTASNTLTFTGTDSSSIAFGAGGTAAYTSNKLSAFAATTSAELAGVISDETGSGALVFANTPTLVTPVLGVATATSIALGGGTALANYVEGTWTPIVTLVGGAGNTVPVYATNSGNHTRIGNRDFFDIYLTGDGGAEGAGTGQINISLPITASASQLTAYCGTSSYINNVTFAVGLVFQIQPNATTLELARTVAGTFTTIIGNDQSSTTRTIRIGNGSCYMV